MCCRFITKELYFDEFLLTNLLYFLNANATDKFDNELVIHQMLNFNTKKSNYSCEQHVAFRGFESDYLIFSRF